ncbi:hypothetical protein AAHE18_05G122300 [Arachis hypogaea]
MQCCHHPPWPSHGVFLGDFRQFYFSISHPNLRGAHRERLRKLFVLIWLSKIALDDLEASKLVLSLCWNLFHIFINLTLHIISALKNNSTMLRLENMWGQPWGLSSSQ